MPQIDALLMELDERNLARIVGSRHDHARINFHLHSNTVSSFDEFMDVVGEYYNYHFSSCVSIGGSMSRAEASGRAREIIKQIYQRRKEDLMTAYNDAADGTNGGLRVILDTIADALKAESVERYIEDAFDRHVSYNSWEDKVEIIRQFIGRCGLYLSASIRTSQPERYARDYKELIRAYVQGLQQTSSIFRRL